MNPTKQSEGECDKQSTLQVTEGVTVLENATQTESLPIDDLKGLIQARTRKGMKLRFWPRNGEKGCQAGNVLCFLCPSRVVLSILIGRRVADAWNLLPPWGVVNRLTLGPSWFGKDSGWLLEK